MQFTTANRSQQLWDQYTLSRRNLLKLMGMSICTPGLESLVMTDGSPPPVDPDPLIPTLPQNDSPHIQQERLDQLQQARMVYELDIRLPNVVRVATLPEQEFFSDGYNATRQELGEQISANQQAFMQNPVPLLTLEDYVAVFPVLPLPDIANTFRLDSAFAHQRIAGANPMELTNVKVLSFALRDKLAITDATFQAVVSAARDGKKVKETIDDTIKDGALFVTDYARLDAVTTKPNQFLAAPIVLYFADRKLDRELIPIAIQLGQIPGESLLLTPLDGADWTLAKIIAQSADLYQHELVRHLGQTHVALEPLALATRRELAPRHPVNVLLLPHFEFTMAINALGDQMLINPGGPVDLFLPGTLESSLDLVDSAVVELYSNFSDFAFPTDLERRGLDDRTIKDLPYRDDGMRIWQELYDYVEKYIQIYYYNNNDAVQADFELQNWLQALRTPVSQGGMGVNSLPETLSDRDTLVDLLMQIIFTAGPQHSAIAWIQYQYMTFIPNMPGALYQPIPTAKGVREEDLVTFMPGVQATVGQLNLLSVIGTKLDPKPFTDFGANNFKDPEAIEELEDFRRELAEVEEKIHQDNEDRVVCYPAFLPSRMANSTSG